MKYLLILGCLLGTQFLFSQQDSIPKIEVDSVNPEKRIFKEPSKPKPKHNPKKPYGISPYGDFTIAEYRSISKERDTVVLDTTLSIDKEYKYNYLRKDDFELMAFANMGRPYNSLGKEFSDPVGISKMGASGKHFNYMEVEDIYYYKVPTPMTELMFKTTMEQGQLVDALLAFNTSERTNISLAYKGFRSLGKYRFSQANSGNFRIGASHSTPNKKYNVQAHFTSQTIENEENGGIENGKKELQFESGDPEFSDRFLIDVNFNNATNKLHGKRYYLQHQYQLIQKKKDSLPIVSLFHKLNYETKIYDFNQTATEPFFGEVLLSPINDRSRLKIMENQLGVRFHNKIFGALGFYGRHYNYTNYYNSILVTPEGTIENRITGEEILVGADYKKQIGAFKVKADLSYSVSGDLIDQIINASAGYKIGDFANLEFKVYSASKMPDFNYLLYHSGYKNYNWQNNKSFKKEKTSSFEFKMDSKIAGKLSAKYTILDNHTYFSAVIPETVPEDFFETSTVKPFQTSETISYLKVSYRKDIHWRKWTLANTIMYQSVSQKQNLLNLPEIVTRNSLFFSSHVFKKAMFIQTGVNFKYFTSYYMDAYNPLLSDFYVQDREEIGGFPMLDFFINAKVRQTRLYLKAEHINTIFTKEYNYYAAPNYPYRDFVIRFGLVWNFFS